MREIIKKYILPLLNSSAMVTTDSRAVKPLCDKGEKVIFFALKGERFDGNKFAEQAVKDGAVVVIADDSALEGIEKIIVVKDGLEALQITANEYRKTLSAKIIAITGSNGKTTTKELLYSVISKKYKTQATKGNLNNHIGVPLTLLSIEKDCQVAIIEMGANHCGEIELLCSITEPDMGLITNIGKAHLEGFGGEEGIMRGKGELFDYLAKNNGKAFYLDECSKLSEMVKSRPTLFLVPYNSNSIVIDSSTTNGLKFSYNNIKSSSNLVGDYNRFNIAAAITVGTFLEIEIEDILEAIDGYVPTNMRSQAVETPHNKIIVDAYNANPSSMKSAIENFENSCRDGVKLYILGDMKELGIYSNAEHNLVVEQIVAFESRALFVGENFMDTTIEGDKILKFKDFEDIYSYLKDNKISGYNILLKGSRSMGLEKLLPLL